MKLQFGPHSVETSNDDKPLFPDSGITKADVIGYYHEIAELMLPHLDGRCLTIQRFPDGIGEDGFYQQKRADYFPDFVGRATLAKAGDDEQVEHIVVKNAAGLVYLADQAAITFHGWLALAGSPDEPDRIVFDLDPSDADFSSVIDCARHLRDALQSAGLIPFVMTTGSRGLHVVAPLSGRQTFDDVREFAKAVADQTASMEPSRFTTEQRKKARRGRLYIDIGRNAYGQTAVIPYSLRSIEGAPVATPLDWGELGSKGLSPRTYHIRNLRRRVAQKDDPFKDFFKHKSKTPAAHELSMDGEKDS